MDTIFNCAGSMKKFLSIFATALAVFFFIFQLSACSLIFLPPLPPSDPFPLDGATNVSTNTRLRWHFQKGARYYLYFGTSSNPPLIASDLATSEYSFSAPLNFSTTYYWKVKAKNFSGEKLSALWYFTTQGVPKPSSPFELKYDWVGTNAVSLSWKENSSNEDGFVVERSQQGSSFSKVGTLTANARTYTDVNVSAGKSYTYRVYAFNGYGKSNPSNEIKVLTPKVEAGILKWKFKASTGVISAPGVDSSKTVYFSAQDALYAVNIDGTLKWKRTIGLTSSVGIGKSLVYVGNVDGVLYAFDFNGQLKWKSVLSPSVSSPAIGADGTVYVRGGSFIYAVDGNNGNVIWKYDIEGTFSSPSIGKSGTIYIGGGNWYLYALNDDGTLKWKYKTGVVFSMPLVSSPSIDEEENVYIEGADWYLYALSKRGILKWKYKSSSLKNYATAPVDVDGNVYMLESNGTLNAIDSNGTLIWTYPSGELLTCPTIGSKGELYVGAREGLFVVENGTLKWKYETSPVQTNPILSQDVVYFGSDDGYLYAVWASSNSLMNSAWPTFSHDERRSGRQR